MKNIIEYAIVPEMPRVSFRQQLNVHVPIASTNNKGVAQYDSAHFSVANGVVRLNGDTLDRFTNIVHVNALPELSDANINVIYCLHNVKYYTFWICEDNTKWLQLDKALYVVESLSDVVDNTKLYYVTDLDYSGVYILYNSPVRILTQFDLDNINRNIQSLADTLATKEAELLQALNNITTNIDDRFQTVNSNINTLNNTLGNNIAQVAIVANEAKNNSTTALNTASSARSVAEDAHSIARESRTTASTALSKAEEALNKSASVGSGLILKGNISTIEELPEPSSDTYRYFYNITSAFVTTDLFVEGEGKSYPSGNNVAIVEVEPGVYKYDVFSGSIDTNDFLKKVDVVANPELAGTESKLNGLEVNGTKYSVGDIGEITLTTEQLQSYLQTYQVTLTIDQVNVFEKYGIVNVYATNEGETAQVLCGLRKKALDSLNSEEIIFEESTYNADGSSFNIFTINRNTNLLTQTNKSFNGVEANIANNTLRVFGYGELKMLPPVTASDSGKFLTVNSSGQWVATTVPNAEESSF